MHKRLASNIYSLSLISVNLREKEGHGIFQWKIAKSTNFPASSNEIGYFFNAVSYSWEFPRLVVYIILFLS